MNVFIIGATSGIGHELWKHYAAKGDKVAVIGRRKTEIDSMVSEEPENTIGVACDISNIEAFNDAFDKVIRDFTTLDLIIICAGIGDLNPELNVQTELSTVGVNVEGWTNCVDRAYNLFYDQKYGHLVAITSVGGLQPTPVAPSYSASKAYQINYTKALQRKSKGTAISVTEIRPGLVDTRMAKGEGLFWVMPLNKVVRATVKAIDKKRNRLIIDGRWRLINF
ncbi:MAG: SDR family NAD(P)-dependent oxidoreductase, partial [Muribaculaceae bacterium]|nr:SDR family NAD(P)-dependent oxidoreductase [Muribaculaceae bacterium]